MQLSGLTREEILNSLNNHPHLGIKEFKAMVSCMKHTHKFKVNKVSIGDIYKVNTLGSHPVVIISIKKGVAYGLLLTSEEKTEFILGPITSRYMEGFVTNTLVTSSLNSVSDKIYTIYGNNKQLSIYKKQFKQLIKTI